MLPVVSDQLRLIEIGCNQIGSEGITGQKDIATYIALLQSDMIHHIRVFHMYIPPKNGILGK